MDLSRIIFLTVMTSIVCGSSVYVGRRLAQTLGNSKALRFAVYLGMACLAFLVLSFFFFSRTFVANFPHEGVRSAYYWIAFTGMGAVSLLLTFYFFVDVVAWMGRLTLRLARLGKRLCQGEAGAHPPGMDDNFPVSAARRRFLTATANAGVVGAAGVLGSVGFSAARETPGVVEIALPVRGLPQDLRGFRIVQITDVHVGQMIGKDFLARVVASINSLEPDIVALTGDAVDGYVEQLRDMVAPFAEIQARFGKFFVTGNHEYYWDGARWCEEMERLGFVVLTNEHRVVTKGEGSVLVSGVTDLTAGRLNPQWQSSPEKARAGAPDTHFKVLLAHQPQSIFEASKVGFDLQLSGHTHGGQYWPWTSVIKLIQPYVAGLYEVDGTWLYVSRGTGYWGPPLRAGSPPEITLVTLWDAE